MKTDLFVLCIFADKIAYWRIHILISECTVDGDHDGAFHALSEELTAVFVNSVYRTCGVVGICGTTAGAIELCPAVTAVGAGINIARTKFALFFFVCNSVPDITQLECLLTDKLMAGIKVTPRGNSHIFGA